MDKKTAATVIIIAGILIIISLQIRNGGIPKNELQSQTESRTTESSQTYQNNTLVERGERQYNAPELTTAINQNVVRDISKIPALIDYPAQQNTSLTDLPIIDLNSHTLGSSFATKINAANETLPNFGGIYSIVTWGCGSSCTQGAVINRATGKILAQLPQVIERNAVYDISSNLLIINPYPGGTHGDFDKIPTHYYVWDGAKFNHIGSYQITSTSVTQIAN